MVTTSVRPERTLHWEDSEILRRYFMNANAEPTAFVVMLAHGEEVVIETTPNGSLEWVAFGRRRLWAHPGFITQNGVRRSCTVGYSSYRECFVASVTADPEYHWISGPIRTCHEQL